MTIERLRRVLYIMEEMAPFTGPDVYSNHQLDIAIGEECGTSDRTLRDTKRQMRKHGLIASESLGLWKISKTEKRELGYGSRQEEERQVLLGTDDRVAASRIPPEPSANYFKVLNQKQETSEDEDFLMNE